MPDQMNGDTARAAGNDATDEVVQLRCEVMDLRVETDNLLKALASRDVIGQAKGILMERLKLTADEAFDQLREASQHSNRKVAELAHVLTVTGEWPVGGVD